MQGTKHSFFLLALLATILGTTAAGCGSSSSGPTITAVAVSPVTATVVAGATTQLQATASWSDGSTSNVTSQSTWTSSSTAVAVDASGLASALVTTPVGLDVTATAVLGGSSGTAELVVVRGAAIGVRLSNDPMALQQWYLENTGQNAYADVGGVIGASALRVEAAYRWGVTGAGVKVAVLDSGLEIAHEDLAANVVPGSWNFVTGTSDPTPPTTDVDGDHGTSVSGIIAMVYGNEKGGMGVASGAKLNGYNILENQTVENYLKAMGSSAASPASADVWVFNESYGASAVEPVPVNEAIEAQYVFGTSTLRGERGALYVKSAGNGFEGYEWGRPPQAANCSAAYAAGLSCQNANMEGENALPYLVVVGALNAAGKRSTYSTAGASIWVTAPGGEYGKNASTAGGGLPACDYQPAMVTTDRSTCQYGYSRSDVTRSAFARGGAPNGNCNYANTFNGTSSAAPSTSGAIALLLDARPSLTWREVKHLLAISAHRIDPTVLPTTVQLSDGEYVAEPGWTVNSAGRYFHNWYGFGAVDVDAAIRAARTFVAGSLGSFQQTPWVESVAGSQAIPDFSRVGVTSTLAVPATPASLTAEEVQIEVVVNHPAPGDLGFELVSPAGTRSVLMNIRNGFGPTTGTTGAVMLSNAFYGEPAVGTWTLKVVDGLATNTGTLVQWRIRAFGH